MKKMLISLVIIVAVIAVFFTIFNLSKDKSSGGGINVVVADNEEGNVAVGNSENVKVFIVDSSHLRFFIEGVENPDIVVSEGDRVRIEFSSSEGFHDWTIDEFNAAAERVSAGSSSSVEFIADRRGTFEYYCSVGNHRAQGMFGTFVVE